MLAAGGCTPAAEEGNRADRIRIGIRQPSSLDPVHLTDSSATSIARQIFEPLLRLDPETLDLEGAVASSWKVFDGGARFVFDLRPGVRFHDGKLVTRDDVVFSLNRLARQQTGSDSAFLLESVAGFEAVRGGTVSDLEGVRSVGSRSIEIRLGAPWAEFPHLLTHPATSIVPKAVVEAAPDALKTKPVGTGPYRMTGQLVVGSDILLRRFPGYRGVQKPSIEEVGFLMYESGAYRDLENGHIDLTDAPVAQAAAARARFGDEGFSPRAAGLYLGFNVSLVADPRIRRTMSLAIDRTAIGASVFGGTLVPADSLVPPVVGTDTSCGVLCRFDAPAAAALLREASPAGNPTLRVSFVTRDQAVFDQVKPTAGAAGITLEPKAQDLANFSSSLVKKEDPVFILGWVAEYPSADWFLNLLFRQGSPDNHSNYGSAEMDDLLRQARAEPDPVKRKRIYARVEEKALDDMVMIPIGFFTNRVVASSRIKGLQVDPMGLYDVARMRLTG